MKRYLYISILLLAVLCSAARAEQTAPAGFVDIGAVIPEAICEVRYHSGDNFVGERIDGYDEPLILMTERCASALKKAADNLKGQGYGLKIFDAYRPQRAVEHFYRWSQNADTSTRERYYPRAAKSELFKAGYIAKKSSHSRGSAVDLTLVDLASGEEVDMGSSFDFFDSISHYASDRITPRQAKNRAILRQAMSEAGFKGIKSEWWHYALQNESYPDRYFDFPIKRTTGNSAVTAADVDSLAISRQTKKLIVVIQREINHAQLSAWLNTDGSWRQLLAAPARIGSKGLNYEKKEGSSTTPAGVYGFTSAFGRADNPGSLLPYKKLIPGDLWVDDPKSKHYNRPVRADAPDRDWNSAEDLYSFEKAYKYVAVIDYNSAPIVPGAGSAIFLHCSTGGATAGCVSVPEKTMIDLLAFIDGETKIVIAPSFQALESF